MDYVKTLDNNINSVLHNYLQKPTIIKGFLHLLLILYVARLAPTPPASLLVLFDNVFFKIFVFSLVLWTAQFSPATSVLIALAFMVTMNYTTRGKFGINGVYEMMENTPITPITSLQAIQTLGSMAASTEPIPQEIVDPLKTIAIAGASTPESEQAVKDLSVQATMSVAGTSENVTNAVNTASEGIISNMPSPTQVVEALKALADAAVSPTAVKQSTVLAVSNIVMSGVTSKSAMLSVQNLTTLAMGSTPGDPAKITADVNNILSEVNKVITEPVSSTPLTPLTTAPSIQVQQSIQALAQGASTDTALPSEVVNPVANIAIAAMNSQQGVEAVKLLAGQSMTASSGDSDKITNAVQIAMSDMSNSTSIMPASTSTSSSPAPVNGKTANHIEPANGCYPIRQYDMSKIMPMKDGASSFENYQEFKSSTPSS